MPLTGLACVDDCLWLSSTWTTIFLSHSSHTKGAFLWFSFSTFLIYYGVGLFFNQNVFNNHWLQGMRTYDYILAMKEESQSIIEESFDEDYSDFSSDDDFDSPEKKPTLVSRLVMCQRGGQVSEVIVLLKKFPVWFKLACHQILYWFTTNCKKKLPLKYDLSCNYTFRTINCKTWAILELTQVLELDPQHLNLRNYRICNNWSLIFLSFEGPTLTLQVWRLNIYTWKSKCLIATITNHTSTVIFAICGLIYYSFTL